ncbi:MAG: carbohydrate binding family 9 domain-containing protein [Opitutaceae bacterium]|jgi:hypothetical protein|nr:carbohydrate binding family 9 domain-containing protein [Opitutaceae bacterium]
MNPRPSKFHCEVVRPLTLILVATGLVLVAAVTFGAQGEPSLTPVPESNSVRMVWATEPPKIDGKLDDAVWAKAEVISNFTQVRPAEGVAPTEKTAVRLLQDDNFLYVGIRAFDSEPDKIIAREMQRDVTLRSEDRVSFSIDTFHNMRSGYYFSMNARGSRQDGLIAPGMDRGGYQTEWDGIWYGKSSIDSLGWMVEMAIPAKTISFDPNQKTWGFNVQRDIKRKGERVRWAGLKRNLQVAHMSDAGVISDIGEFSQGRGFDILPYLKANYKKDSVTGTDGFEFEPGLDLFYKLTPAVTLALTINTDFAESEVDARQVNLTRFPLFFEEKRDFFLQDSNIFRFADLERSPLPFHSRRIGLGRNREPLDILAGGKITGRIGDLNFGLLNVMVDEFEDLGANNLTVARTSMNVLSESETGIIATIGDPTSDDNNALIGYDFNYKNSDFSGSGQTVESNFYVMKSFTSDLSGDDFAYGATLTYPNSEWEWGLKAEQIEENFNPALGFIQEAGVRQFEGELERSWHPQAIGTINLNTSAERRTRIDGELINQEVRFLGFGIESPIRDELELAPLFIEEQLFEPWEIIDGVVIPPGKYSFSRMQVEVGSAESRQLSGYVGVEFGDFFSGTRTNVETEVGWRPAPFFNISASYETNIIDLPEGDFTVDVVQVNFNIPFSPDLAWNITSQWDSESEKYGMNSRIRWTIKPGNELFLVFNQEMDTSRGSWRTLKSDISTKAAMTFRF